MYNPIKAYFDYRLEKERIQAEVANKPFETVKEMIVENAKVLHEWMEGFKVTDLTIPQSTVVRDFDEYQEEMAREFAAGQAQQGDFEGHLELENRVKTSLGLY